MIGSCPKGPLDEDSPNAGLRGNDALDFDERIRAMTVRRGQRVWREVPLGAQTCFCHEYIEIDPVTGKDKV